jgi:hypothetical protein
VGNRTASKGRRSLADVAIQPRLQVGGPAARCGNNLKTTLIPGLCGGPSSHGIEVLSFALMPIKLFLKVPLGILSPLQGAQGNLKLQSASRAGPYGRSSAEPFEYPENAFRHIRRFRHESPRSSS